LLSRASKDALRTAHESRIVLPPNAGVAELADALDSKSAVMLRSNAAIAVLLPSQRILVASRIALECELISALLGVPI
jgi:hypothetical protein